MGIIGIKTIIISKTKSIFLLRTREKVEREQGYKAELRTLLRSNR